MPTEEASRACEVVEGAHLHVRPGTLRDVEVLGAAGGLMDPRRASGSPATARNHLRQFIVLGMVIVFDDEHHCRYYPDLIYVRFVDIRTVLNDTTMQDLTGRAAELNATIAAWRAS